MERHPKKLTVYAFKDKRLEQRVAAFVLPLNPEQYAQTFKVEYDVKTAQGAQGVEARFKASAPEELKLDFLFDGTDTAYGYAQPGLTVPEQLDAFKAVAYDLAGDIHQPRYLKLVWKDFTFDCILTEMQVTYTLFDPEGTPLRAKLSCTFLNYKETERRVREENKSSPDLTHLRTVRAHDTLPLMTHGIYGTPGYYLQVARANDLNTFRTLREGSPLYFPPHRPLGLMTDERLIPVDGNTSVVTQTLLIDGVALPPVFEVLSIVTTKEANRIPTARIVFRDGDAAKETFELSNRPELLPGGTLEIRAGFASQETTIFKGLLVKQGLKIREQGGSALFVEARDAAVKMTVGRHSRYFVDQTDSDVFAALIEPYGLTPDVEATDVTHAELVQYHATDWDYLLTRADVNGRLVLVDDGTVAVQAPVVDGEADLSVLFGSTLYALDAEMDARRQYQAVKAFGWDYSRQAVLEEAGTAPAASRQGNVSETDLAATLGLDALDLRHTGRVEDVELRAWADARLVRSHLAKITGRVEIRGYPDVKPGQRLELGGLGDRFNGVAYITGVRHDISRGSWYTQVQFGLAPDLFGRPPDVAEMPAAGLLPPLHGLQVGITTKLEGDPDGEDRIQVRLPLIDPAHDGLWCRVACPDAGAERGVFFRPEIGDEVVVGFLNDDPRDPIVLGMLHSSALPAPLPLADDNHEKGVFTRSKMRLHFDDETSIITIDTPAGNSLVISDDDQSIILTDQHGNTLTMNADGITLDASNITLNAREKITATAGTDLSEEAGANVSVKAGAQYKAEGSAGAELSAGGETVVKGALVRIN